VPKRRDSNNRRNLAVIKIRWRGRDSKKAQVGAVEPSGGCNNKSQKKQKGGKREIVSWAVGAQPACGKTQKKRRGGPERSARKVCCSEKVQLRTNFESREMTCSE